MLACDDALAYVLADGGEQQEKTQHVLDSGIQSIVFLLVLRDV
jgi:hypothetical protein